jgi:hypothetical protein
MHYDHRRESIGDAYIFHHHLLCCQYGHVGSLEFDLETKIAIESIKYQQKQNKQVAYIMEGKKVGHNTNTKTAQLGNMLVPQLIWLFRNNSTIFPGP